MPELAILLTQTGTVLAWCRNPATYFAPLRTEPLALLLASLWQFSREPPANVVDLHGRFIVVAADGRGVLSALVYGNRCGVDVPSARMLAVNVLHAFRRAFDPLVFVYSRGDGGADGGGGGGGGGGSDDNGGGGVGGSSCGGGDDASGGSGSGSGRDSGSGSDSVDCSAGIAGTVGGGASGGTGDSMVLGGQGTTRAFNGLQALLRLDVERCANRQRTATTTRGFCSGTSNAAGKSIGGGDAPCLAELLQDAQVYRGASAVGAGSPASRYGASEHEAVDGVDPAMAFEEWASSVLRRLIEAPSLHVKWLAPVLTAPPAPASAGSVCCSRANTRVGNRARACFVLGAGCCRVSGTGHGPDASDRPYTTILLELRDADATQALATSTHAKSSHDAVEIDLCRALGKRIGMTLGALAHVLCLLDAHTLGDRATGAQPRHPCSATLLAPLGQNPCRMAAKSRRLAWHVRPITSATSTGASASFGQLGHVSVVLELEVAMPSGAVGGHLDGSCPYRFPAVPRLGTRGGDAEAGARHLDNAFDALREAVRVRAPGDGGSVPLEIAWCDAALNRLRALGVQWEAPDAATLLAAARLARVLGRGAGAVLDAAGQDHGCGHGHVARGKDHRHTVNAYGTSGSVTGPTMRSVYGCALDELSECLRDALVVYPSSTSADAHMQPSVSLAPQPPITPTPSHARARVRACSGSELYR